MGETTNNGYTLNPTNTSTMPLSLYKTPGDVIAHCFQNRWQKF